MITREQKFTEMNGIYQLQYFIDCDFSGAVLNAVFHNCEFSGCRFDGAAFTGSVLFECVLTECSLLGADLSYVEFSNTIFNDCPAKGALIENSMLSGVIGDGRWLVSMRRPEFGFARNVSWTKERIFIGSLEPLSIPIDSSELEIATVFSDNFLKGNKGKEAAILLRKLIALSPATESI